MFAFLHSIDWAGEGRFLAAASVLGYLLGSIPFGIIFARLAGAGDLRKIGSGNIGTTNVLRTGKRWAALATLVGDIAKGALAALLARALAGDMAAVFAGFCAFLGHLFPLWLRFRGGKGVATALGVIAALCWPVGLLGLATWLAATAVWRISSLSALIAAGLVPLYMMLFCEPLYAMLTLVLALFIFATHRDNIARILDRREPRLDEKRSGTS